MANRFAIANGNWSNTAIWDNGALPVAGDFVFANGFTVTIDQNVNVGYISNGASPVYVPSIATPAMTGTSSPSGTASASSVNGGLLAWLAFDQTTANNWLTTTTTAWLRYDFPSAKIIRRYALLGYPSQSNNPRNWTFEGSNDGSTWTVIHTVTLGAAIAASAWYDSGVFANSTAYLYYRLNITLGGGSLIGLNEFQMTESTSTAVGNNPNGTFTMPTAYNITCTHTNGIYFFGTSNVNPLLTISATTGSININSNIRQGALANSNCLLISGAGHNITITGDVFGGSAGSGACIAINRNASGTLTINGVLYCGTVSSSNYTLLNNSLGAGTINVNGAITATGSAVAAGLYNLAVCTINFIGNISGNITNQNTTYFYNNAASTINMIGNISPSSSNFNSVVGIQNIANSTINITGNLSGGSTSTAGNNTGINTSLGTVIITGNINGGSTNSGVGTNYGVAHTGGTLTINGNITGGTNTSGLLGNGTSATINGDVYASATAPGAESTSNTALFLFNGSAYGNGYVAPFAVRRLGITPNSSMVYRMANATGGTYNFYPIGSTALGTPATTDVRNGVVYGSGALTGTLVVPPPTAVTVGVTYDNGTLGTAQNTAASFLAALGASTDPLAVRLQNVSTVQTTGAQIAAYNV